MLVLSIQQEQEDSCQHIERVQQAQAVFVKHDNEESMSVRTFLEVTPAKYTASTKQAWRIHQKQRVLNLLLILRLQRIRCTSMLVSVWWP
jgi:hypothetical protein